MRRFFCPDIPAVNDQVELADDQVKHLRTVLRDADGSVVLLDGMGTVATATLLPDQNRRRARLRILERRQMPEPKLKLHLYVAPPRSKLMSQLVRQTTELGVWAIHPIITDRSVADPKSEAQSWTAQAREAIKQSGNPWLPKLLPPRPFRDALAEAPPGWVGAPAYLQPNTRISRPTAPEQAVWIGPEGGFSDMEIAALSERAYPVPVGDWILRVETAAVAVIAAIHHSYGFPAS